MRQQGMPKFQVHVPGSTLGTKVLSWGSHIPRWTEKQGNWPSEQAMIPVVEEIRQNSAGRSGSFDSAVSLWK